MRKVGDQGVSETTSAIFLRTSFSGTNTFEITDLSKMRLTLDLNLLGLSVYALSQWISAASTISAHSTISAAVCRLRCWQVFLAPVVSGARPPAEACCSRFLLLVGFSSSM